VVRYMNGLTAMPGRQWLHVVRESWLALKHVPVFGLARRGLIRPGWPGIT